MIRWNEQNKKSYNERNETIDHMERKRWMEGKKEVNPDKKERNREGKKKRDGSKQWKKDGRKEGRIKR